MTDIEYTQENQQAQPYKNSISHQWLTRKEKRISELEKELAEEARLNGMGAEREAKLLARVAELEKRIAELEAQVAMAKEFIENRSVE